MTRNYTAYKSNQQGKQMEQLIELACKHYEIKRIAKIVKIPEPFRVVKLLGNNQFNGRFIGKAEPDFFGSVKGGKVIVFESKYTSKDRINQTVISENQKKCLDLYEQVNAIAGVCVGINKTYGFVPWEKWKEMAKRYGRKYMTEEELKEFEVPTPGYIDFLSNILD